MPLRIIILSTAVAFICSCQHVDVNVVYNKEVDFFKYKTFNWMKVTDQKNKDYTSIQELNLRKVFRSVLAERGLTLKADKPDTLAVVTFVEKEKVHYSPRFSHFYNDHWGYFGHWNHYEADYYTESTLVFALIDPDTREALWEGSVEDWNYNATNQERLEKMIRALLENYPPTDTEAYTPVP